MMETSSIITRLEDLGLLYILRLRAHAKVSAVFAEEIGRGAWSDRETWERIMEVYYQGLLDLLAAAARLGFMDSDKPPYLQWEISLTNVKIPIEGCQFNGELLGIRKTKINLTLVDRLQLAFVPNVTVTIKAKAVIMGSGGGGEGRAQKELQDWFLVWVAASFEAQLKRSPYSDSIDPLSQNLISGQDALSRIDLVNLRILMTEFVVRFMPDIWNGERVPDPLTVFFLRPKKSGSYPASGYQGYVYHLDKYQSGWLSQERQDGIDALTNEKYGLPFPYGFCGRVFLTASPCGNDVPVVDKIGEYGRQTSGQFKAIEEWLFKDYSLLEVPIYYPEIDGRLLAGPQLILGFRLPIFKENGTKPVSMPVDLAQALAPPKGSVLQLGEAQLIIEYAEHLIGRYLRVQRPSSFLLEGICGESSKMKELYEKLNRVVQYDEPVLLLGETGVGKGVIAKAIHVNSERGKQGQPYIPTPLLTVPESLIDSALFGHVRGAYTGAEEARKGTFECAQNGTIFLDEIGKCPKHIQEKLLRVIQEGTFERVGSSEEIQVNVRVIAATNENIEAAIKGGTFLKDLFYRLNVLTLFVPPLRERQDEIAPIANKVVTDMNKRYSMNKILLPGALHKLCDYNFPGNIRELETIVRRAFVLSEGSQITESSITFETGAISEKPGLGQE